MITLDDFMEKRKMVQKPKIFQNKTKKEYSLKDLPQEIMKNPKKWINEIKKMHLSQDQIRLIELIENGAKHRIQKGKKKEVVEIIEPYSPYLLLQLQKSLRREGK